MYFILIVFLLILDQSTKYLIQHNFDIHQSVPVIDGAFHITYIQNFGAAFSILQGEKFLLIGFTSIALAALLIYIFLHIKKSRPLMLVSLSFIFGGGVGNLIDRIRLGYVVDFFDFRIWPVFNFADTFVVCGCGLLLIYMFIIEPRIAKKDLGVVQDND